MIYVLFMFTFLNIEELYLNEDENKINIPLKNNITRIILMTNK